MTEIALHNVAKTYNPGLFKRKVRALHDLSLEVASGEVFGLIGPNGAGKSTTIRLLLGLMRPDSGEILFKGETLGQNPAILSQVGYLPENPYLYEHLTLNELLAFCGRVSGMTAASFVERSGELMEKLNLVDARKRPLRTFSKGMLQRAGICFALLHDPSIVILDEPMSGLDPLGRKMVFDLVIELKNQGKTIFFCSHILTDVERLCDRIGLLVRGRLCNVYSKELFAQSSKPLVHLVVGPLSVAQRSYLNGLVKRVADERGRHILSVSPSSLSSVGQYLTDVGVEILASREESFSLEEVFMQAVEENS